MSAPVESGLADIRLEWVSESTPGTTPTDPSWNKFSGEVSEFSYSSDGNKEARQVLGQIDAEAHDRSSESTTATISYRQSKFPVDSSDNVQDPIAYPIVEDATDDYPSHTVMMRRDVAGGGADGAGFREFAVIRGARPVGATFDGDPSSSEPIPQELSYEAERARTHIVSQPSSSSKLVVSSTDDGDSNDVVIEDEDASTTETVTLPATSPNEVETTSSFGDIDAIKIKGDHAGDITVGTSDGGSPATIDVQLTDKPITGSNTDGVDSDPGIPALGSGSHASAISTTGPQFIGTNATWSSNALGDRVHATNLSVERDVSRNARQSTRAETIDVGPRTITADADIAGPFETATAIKEHHRDKSGDFVWTFDSGETITLKNAVLIDAPDFTRSAGETNYVPSVSFEASGDPAIQIDKS